MSIDDRNFKSGKFFDGEPGKFTEFFRVGSDGRVSREDNSASWEFCLEKLSPLRQSKFVHPTRGMDKVLMLGTKMRPARKGAECWGVQPVIQRSTRAGVQVKGRIEDSARTEDTTSRAQHGFWVLQVMEHGTVVDEIKGRIGESHGRRVHLQNGNVRQPREAELLGEFHPVSTINSKRLAPKRLHCPPPPVYAKHFPVGIEYFNIDRGYAVIQCEVVKLVEKGSGSDFKNVEITQRTNAPLNVANVGQHFADSLGGARANVAA
jgi:hypothetical protein